MTGATNSWKVKIADVGKPGRITTGTGRLARRRTAARHSGLPGLRATPWATMPGGPSSATTRYDRSPSPLDVPPESSTTSHARASAQDRGNRRRGRRGRCPASPARRPARGRRRPGSSRCCRRRNPGRIGWPGAISSSPVETMATRGGGTTLTRPTPSAASTPVSREVSSSPRRRTVSPRPMSVPGEGDVAPGRDRPPHEQGVGPSVSVCSTMTTASAPRGSIAPVAMASPAPGRTVTRGVTPGGKRFARRAAAVAADPRRRRRCPPPAPRSRPRWSDRSPARPAGRRRPPPAPAPARRPAATSSAASGRRSSTARKRRSASSRSITSRNWSCCHGIRHAGTVVPLNRHSCAGGVAFAVRGTSTKPSARVVELRIDAPLMASGSTCPSRTRTRT